MWWCWFSLSTLHLYQVAINDTARAYGIRRYATGWHRITIIAHLGFSEAR
jgi:hypothetical protein